MHPDELLEAIRIEGAAVVAVLQQDCGANDVPSYPGWDVEKLVGHLGRVHRWVTAMVRARSPRSGWTSHRARSGSTGSGSRRAWRSSPPPSRKPDPTSPMWTFPGGGGTSRFWFRRQAEETAVHRWDAELAVGRPGSDRHRGRARRHRRAPRRVPPGRQAELGGTVRFDATDSPHGEWIVTKDADGGLLVGHGHDAGDVTLRATASDLLLWLWGRPVSEGGLEVVGDEALLDQWRAGFSLA